MDLLTVVTHELGHILGLPDVSATFLPNDLMDTTLPTGTRRLPSATDVDAVFAGGFETTSATPVAAPQAFVLASPLASDDDEQDWFEVDPALAQAWAAWQSTTSTGPGNPNGNVTATEGATVEIGRNSYFSAMGQIGRWFQT
jgi:hypothetical protein